ncbi:putative glycosyltransferase [Algibacter lectus]|uniref:Putative glycosyltransferase n=2 Tax=Algibacter lectus TaxID=221126 RepID=A0A090VDX5_9FLAO|nr:putative glycosyltransferase [Algibacter lectus]
MVKAFSEILHKLNVESKLLIIGSGPEFDNLKTFIDQNNLENRIRMFGHISDYDVLRGLYSTSIASISPGYVGLSITQSLGFGVPMIISKGEPHSPELEAAIIGENAEYFKTDNVDDLAEILFSFYSKKTQWFMKRDEISKKM